MERCNHCMCKDCLYRGCCFSECAGDLLFKRLNCDNFKVKELVDDESDQP